MLPPLARARLACVLLALSFVLYPLLVSCGSHERPLLPRSQTWAELRTIRRTVTVAPPHDPARRPYPRERLVDGEVVRVEPEGLAWLRRDGGATLLLRGPAELTLRSDTIELAEGRVFIDTPSGKATEIVTPSGPLHLAHVRAGIDVGKDATEVYVLAGEVRTDGAGRAGAGERLTISGRGKDREATAAPVLAWDDWTGGLATTDRAAAPSPYGVGTVGARRPGDQGAPRFPLAIQKLDVRVTIEQDFALTEVDEVFFNPSSETVEGVYRFRAPSGATLHRFGVDREGVIKWGRVKEKQAAAAQYQANVYQGSTEDPALLEWDAPGVYRARLYPIGPGETRRVVVRYAEWLARTGDKHERRLYVYPMAAEGAEESLPHIEELYAAVNLAHASAKDVRVGMAGVRDGDLLIVRERDLVPRADLSIELFDDGPSPLRGYRSPHVVDEETLPPSERAEALRKARNEADYVLVPVWDAAPEGAAVQADGLDLAIVVDTSAATDLAALAVARAATSALLSHLGKADRAVVWAGDAGLRPVVPGEDKLAALDEAARREVERRLAFMERGGATDLGAMLAAAAAGLDPAPARRGAVVYLGDGAPTVGELALTDLRERLSKLPRPVRIFGLGIGDSADMAILAGLSRGAFAERLGDANAAARAALRLLEIAERPARLGASVDLGPTVERVFPRDLGAVVEGDGRVVVGRLLGTAPSSMLLKTAAGDTRIPIRVTSMEDQGDLRRRWAEGRLAQMMDEGVGRAAMVDLGSRNGIITPVTSLYVPTKNEMTAEEKSELEAAQRKLHRPAGKREASGKRRRLFGADKSAPVAEQEPDDTDNKEGGSGTRAKGEEGSMGNPSRGRFGVAGHADAVDSPKPSLRADRDQARAVAAGPAPSTAPAAPAPPPFPVAVPMAAKMPAGGQAVAAGDTNELRGGKGDLGGAATRRPAREASKGGETIDTELPNQDARVRGPAQSPPVDALGGFNGAFAQAPGDPLSWATGKDVVADGEALPTTSEHWNHHVAAETTLNAGAVPRQSGVDITIRFGDPAHFARRCGSAAFLPLEERVALWRERLAPVAGDARGVANVYRRALAWCEAPSWRERARLTTMLLDAMPTIQGRVQLWRIMFGDLGASDAIYRGMLARVRTPEEARALHDALGLKTIDPGYLAKLLKDQKTPGERVTKLRGLAAEWPDDFALALKLLDALEDAGDDAGARDFARKLRARPDADARVRTAVGELYLRLAARAEGPAQKALDESEARRAFGEIVEFSPEDPIARRRIGDLLRAHGWYADAARQYETLARLTPDDASVPLLLAAAADGMGKLEEAVKWTEKSGASGAPDAEQSAGRTARAFAATYLAWGRLEALAAGRAEEAKALSIRLQRVRSSERTAHEELRGARVSLVWSHPEMHPTLWTNALGAPMPAPEGDVTLGVAAATVPARPGAFVEVRIEPDEVEHTARLGAEAILTVVFAEGEAGEKIVKTKVTFSRTDPPVRRFSLAGNEVKEATR